MVHINFAKLRSTVSVLAAAGLLVAAPLTVRHDPVSGHLSIEPAIAHASNGSDDGGGDDRGGDRDRSGSDDHGGSGHGRGRGRGRGSDDSGVDDNGSGHRHGGRTQTGTGQPGSTPTDDNTARQIAKLERNATGVEVTYTDGWKEELQNGRYELKDANRRTVVERPATAEDIARLGAL